MTDSLRLIRLAVLIVTSSCLPLTATAQDAPKLLLHVPFNDSVDAAVAVGEAKGTFKQSTGYSDQKSDQPVFRDGIRGKALEVGQYDYQIEYNPKGNMDFERGTLLFWGKRLGEKPENPYTYFYLSWNQADGSWVMVYNWTYNPLLALHGRGGSGDIGVHLGGEHDDDGDWHMIGLTWDGRRMRGYFDGDPIKGADGDVEDFPLAEIAAFRVGPGTGVSRVIDELKIYDRPLSPAEIKRRYRQTRGIEPPTYLTIPPRRAPIAIDGQIKPDEWRHAVRTTDFVRNDVTRPKRPARAAIHLRR